MTLAERVHLRILKNPRLHAIPPAVVEDVLAIGLQALADMVPMETLASEITTIDFDACEGCGHLIDPDHPEGARRGGEDCIWLCDACVVEGGGAAAECPECGGSGGHTGGPAYCHGCGGTGRALEKTPCP